MKKISLLTIFSLVVLPLVAVFAPNVKAAGLTDVTVVLSNETASATGVGMTVTFTPVTAITTGSVLEITYDSGFLGGASLADADVTVTGTNITTSVESAFAAGYFKSTLTTSASVTTLVTVVIDNAPGLTNPVAGNYGVSVTADIGGLGTTYDMGAGLAYVANDNDVTVSATVPPVIDMEIYQQNSATMTNVCPLGVLSLNKVSTCIYDVAGATNNGTGLTIKVKGVDTTDWTTGEAYLEHSNNTDNINAVADGAVTAGAEEYGFGITDDGSADQYAGGAYEGTQVSVPTSETTFATTAATIDGINTQADRLEVTHYASMATSTVVGSYNQGVVYTAYTN